jgi:hypothetical protein
MRVAHPKPRRPGLGARGVVGCRQPEQRQVITAWPRG